MATANQSLKLLLRNNAVLLKSPNLKGSPQRKTVVLRLRICTPSKPNSARRPTVKGYMSSKLKVLAYIHGSGHTLNRHSSVLICGGGARDLPVVNYSCMRGVYDFEPNNTNNRRSIYGSNRPVELRTHVRRRYSELAE